MTNWVNAGPKLAVLCLACRVDMSSQFPDFVPATPPESKLGEDEWLESGLDSDMEDDEGAEEQQHNPLTAFFQNGHNNMGLWQD